MCLVVVGGFNPLEKISKSIGKMQFLVEKKMFQTTNQTKSFLGEYTGYTLW